MPTAIATALALHTASPELGLAACSADGQLRSQVWDLGRALSTDLHLRLAEFYPPQEFKSLDFLAVACGPGSFTGTRIGMVAARTLAQQFDLPLFAVSTLAAAARDRGRREGLTPTTEIVTRMSAVRGKCFVGIYRLRSDGYPLAVVPDRLEREDDWDAIVAGRSQPGCVVDADGGLGRSVTSVLEIARLQYQQGDRPHWSQALPFYGQHPVDG